MGTHQLHSAKRAANQGDTRKPTRDDSRLALLRFHLRLGTRAVSGVRHTSRLLCALHYLHTNMFCKQDITSSTLASTNSSLIPGLISIGTSAIIVEASDQNEPLCERQAHRQKTNASAFGDHGWRCECKRKGARARASCAQELLCARRRVTGWHTTSVLIVSCQYFCVEVATAETDTLTPINTAGFPQVSPCSWDARRPAKL